MCLKIWWPCTVFPASSSHLPHPQPLSTGQQLQVTAYSDNISILIITNVSFKYNSMNKIYYIDMKDIYLIPYSNAWSLNLNQNISTIGNLFFTASFEPKSHMNTSSPHFKSKFSEKAMANHIQKSTYIHQTFSLQMVSKTRTYFKEVKKNKKTKNRCSLQFFSPSYRI